MKNFIVLSIYEGHMASACIMINGEVIAAAHEERFSRIKCDVAFHLKLLNIVLHKLELISHKLIKLFCQI